MRGTSPPPGVSLGPVPSRRSRVACLVGLALLALPALADEQPIHDSAEAVQPLQPGTRVPGAELRSVSGEAVDLAALVAERGALLVFYRGGW